MKKSALIVIFFIVAFSFKASVCIDIIELNSLKERPFLKESSLTVMVAEKIPFEDCSHSYPTNIDLNNISEEELKHEIVEGKRLLYSVIFGSSSSTDKKTITRPFIFLKAPPFITFRQLLI